MPALVQVAPTFRVELHLFPNAAPKLGQYPHVVDAAAETLTRFASQLEVDPVLLVVTGGGSAYTGRTGLTSYRCRYSGREQGLLRTHASTEVQFKGVAANPGS